MASAFGVATEVKGKPPSLEELWENMPPMQDIKDILENWGIWSDHLDKVSAQKRYARFNGLDLGVAPKHQWGELRR